MIIQQCNCQMAPKDGRIQIFEHQSGPCCRFRRASTDRYRYWVRTPTKLHGPICSLSIPAIFHVKLKVAVLRICFCEQKLLLNKCELVS